MSVLSYVVLIIKLVSAAVVLCTLMSLPAAAVMLLLITWLPSEFVNLIPWLLLPVESAFIMLLVSMLLSEVSTVIP